MSDPHTLRQRVEAFLDRNHCLDGLEYDVLATTVEMFVEYERRAAVEEREQHIGEMMYRQAGESLDDCLKRALNAIHSLESL